MTGKRQNQTLLVFHTFIVLESIKKAVIQTALVILGGWFAGIL